MFLSWFFYRSFYWRFLLLLFRLHIFFFLSLFWQFLFRFCFLYLFLFILLCRNLIQPINTDELNDFLSRIDDVQSQVKDIIDGKVKLTEVDKREMEREKIEKAKLEVQEREKMELLRKGKAGKGHQGRYLAFCKYCFREF